METSAIIALTGASLSFAHKAMDVLEKRKLNGEMTKEEACDYENLVAYRLQLPRSTKSNDVKFNVQPSGLRLGGPPPIPRGA